MAIMTQITTFQLMDLIYLTRDIRRVTNEVNQNLTPSQKQLLRWNFRLGHIGSQHVQWLIQTFRLKVQGNSKAVANCAKCSDCEFGKGHYQSNKVHRTKKNPINEKDLKKDHLLPGQMVYIYHYILRDLERSNTQKGNQINLI